MARLWFGPDGFSEVYQDRLADLGDPVTKRRRQAEAESVRRLEGDDDEWTASVLQRATESQRAEVRDQLIAWAFETHLLAPIDDGKLWLAFEMQWPDVFEALSQNRWLLATWLEIDERDDQFDEPGLLVSSTALLAWSRAAPSAFLARLIATAMDWDFVSLAVQAAERSCEARPKEREHFHFVKASYEAWNQTLQQNLAVAWFRCRHCVPQS